jgi:hypothetical protein
MSVSDSRHQSPMKTRQEGNHECERHKAPTSDEDQTEGEQEVSGNDRRGAMSVTDTRHQPPMKTRQEGSHECERHKAPTSDEDQIEGEQEVSGNDRRGAMCVRDRRHQPPMKTSSCLRSPAGGRKDAATRARAGGGNQTPHSSRGRAAHHSPASVTAK